MLHKNFIFMALWPLLACALFRSAARPMPTLEQLSFELQTATPTMTPVAFLVDVPTDTPDPNLTPTPALTATLIITSTVHRRDQTDEPVEAINTPAPESESTQAPALPTIGLIVAPAAEPLQGGVWDFEDGFATWLNPHGDNCPGSGLANGWTAFTGRDQYGSACMNYTSWPDNVYTGENAQEITFAYVGIQAGIFRTAPAIPGHRYTVEAYMRREFSPAKVEVALGIDVGGGLDWQAQSVQWFPWNEDLDDAWAKTEATVAATGQAMTIFIKGAHPYPEPGGTLRLDSVRIIDLGPE